MIGLRINKHGVVAQVQRRGSGAPWRVRLVGSDHSGTWFTARGTWAFTGLPGY